ncbi:MAG: hypothetical protein DRP12_03630, partial [Candidatus Aenigmatarchaeota archaeon]
MEEGLAVQIGKGAGWIFLGMLVSYIISFFYRIFTARWLGPADYGILSLVYMILGFGFTFFNFGMTTALTKLIAEYRAKGKDISAFYPTGLFAAAGFGFLSFILFYFLAFPLSNLFGVQTFYFSLAAFIIPFMLLASITAGILRGFKRMDLSSLCSISERLSRFLFTLALLFLGYGVFGAIVSIFLGYFLCFCFGFYLYTRLKKFFFSFKPEVAKLLLTFGFSVFITMFASTFLGSTDTFFIGYFLSKEWVGYYNAALPVQWVLALAISSLATAIMPFFSELSAKADARLKETLRRSLKYAVYLLLPTSLAGFVLAEPIMEILFGPEYLAGAQAFRILAFAALFMGLKQLTDSYLIGIGRPKVVMKFVIFAACVNAVLNWFFVQLWGIQGAALATTISIFLIFALSLGYISRRITTGFPRYF